jgi:hypothetical protein
MSRSALAGLAAAVKAAEPGTTNLGVYVAGRSEELAALLGVPASNLASAEHVADEELAPHLEALLKKRELDARRGHRR